MDTHGWDVLCACSQAKLNDLLAKRLAKVPPKLAYSDSAGTTINAEFDPWSITEFGSDKRLTMRLPIKTGVIGSTSKFSTSPAIKLDGTVIEISLDLEFIDNAAAGTRALVFNYKAPAASSTDTTPGAIYVVNPDVTGALAKTDPTGSAVSVLHDHVPQCLIANRDALAFALSVLQLAPAGDAAWLTPVAVDYGFVEGKLDAAGNRGPGYLLVKSMVRNLDPKSRNDQIDPTLVDFKHDLCIAFHPEIFLEHIIMPSLPASFPGSVMLPGYKTLFAMCGDVIRSQGVLKCPTVENAGTHYYPVLSSLQVSVKSDQLVADGAGMFDITGLKDSSVTFSVTQGMHCTYDVAKKALKMAAAGSPTSTYNKHIPAWIYIVAAPAILVVGLVLGLVVVAVVDIVVAAVTSAVAARVTAAGGTVGVGDWALKAVSWPGSDAFDMDEGGLSDAFYMRGSLA